MIFGINTTRDVSKIVSNFTHLTAREITYDNFEKYLEVFMPNITTNHAITYTNYTPSNTCPTLKIRFQIEMPKKTCVLFIFCDYIVICYD